jgi:hypothetical protein
MVGNSPLFLCVVHEEKLCYSSVNMLIWSPTFSLTRPRSKLGPNKQLAFYELFYSPRIQIRLTVQTFLFEVMMDTNPTNCDAFKLR